MAPQVSRLLIVFIVLAVAFLALRAAMVPASFGKRGFYRADALKMLADRPMAHAGRLACLKCHEDNVKASLHFKAGVSCEVCHGPALAHVEDCTDVKLYPLRPKLERLCGTCHAMIPGRRSSFPQVTLKDHNPGVACKECHQFHSQEVPK